MKMKVNNEELATSLILDLKHLGVHEFCICPGARNAPIISVLEKHETLNIYSFYDERSAAFFALGRTRHLKKPVAIVTTSGSAAGELLPAVMEAYYSATPIILITADRPKRYRGTGAPQSCEQVGLFGCYVSYAIDLEGDDRLDIDGWDHSFPLHINICFEDPKLQSVHLFKEIETPFKSNQERLDHFLEKASSLLVIVSGLKHEDRASVLKFLVELNAPVILEASSQLREEVSLQAIQISDMQVLKNAEVKIDSVLRIGSIPLLKYWRDLEELQDEVNVLSITPLPFKGLTFGDLIQENLREFLPTYQLKLRFLGLKPSVKHAESKFQEDLKRLFDEEKFASPSLIHTLSKRLENEALIYLGNSLPIREWDLAATKEMKEFKIEVSRGINGIDGQLSTFYGLLEEKRENYAILGDLTTLYDISAPWIVPQIEGISSTVFVINNGGGKIFERMFSSNIFQNNHELSFKPMADLWGLEYACWNEIPEKISISKKSRLIEIRPDDDSSKRFYELLYQPKF